MRASAREQRYLTRTPRAGAVRCHGEWGQASPAPCHTPCFSRVLHVVSCLAPAHEHGHLTAPTLGQTCIV